MTWYNSVGGSHNLRHFGRVKIKNFQILFDVSVYLVMILLKPPVVWFMQSYLCPRHVTAHHFGVLEPGIQKIWTGQKSNMPEYEFFCLRNHLDICMYICVYVYNCCFWVFRVFFFVHGNTRFSARIQHSHGGEKSKIKTTSLKYYVFFIQAQSTKSDHIDTILMCRNLIFWRFYFSKSLPQIRNISIYVVKMRQIQLYEM